MARSWQDRVVENELKYHGFFHGIQLAADGFSPINILSQLLMPKGPPSGHKILVMEPPERWWRIHRLFLTLEVDHQTALIARYSIPPDENGVMLTHKEVARICGWKPYEYRTNLVRAKKSYKIKVFI